MVAEGVRPGSPRMVKSCGRVKGCGLAARAWFRSGGVFLW